MPETMSTALTPGVALTSAVIYWANLQARLSAVSDRLRTLNAELRNLAEGAPRTAGVRRQIKVFVHRIHVLHNAVVLSVVMLVAFVIASAALFLAPREVVLRRALASGAFYVGLATFAASLGATLWEMLLARQTLDTDVATSAPRPADHPPPNERPPSRAP
jgi:hypothetical protein